MDREQADDLERARAIDEFDKASYRCAELRASAEAAYGNWMVAVEKLRRAEADRRELFLAALHTSI